MRIVFLFLIFWLLFAGFAISDVIVLKDSNAKPVYGRIVDQTETAIVLDEMASSDVLAPRRVPFAIDDVDLVIKNIDANRLAELHPSRLGEYRNYAEELATQKADPAAQEVAIRLFLMAAYWSSDNTPAGQSMKRGALNGLMELARDQNERHSFRSLVQLHGGEVASRDESQPGHSVNKPSESSNNDQAVLEIVRMLRQGKSSQVLEKLENAKNTRAIERWSEVCSQKDLRRMTGQNRLHANDLRRLLTIELAIENGQSIEGLIASQKTSRAGNDWINDAESLVPAAAVLPRLERVTEFDPRKAIYRNGRWIKPAESR